MKKVAAFFDFDRTIIGGNSQLLEAAYIVRNQKCSLFYLLRLMNVLAAAALFRMNLVTYNRYNEIYLRTHAGKPLWKLEHVAALFSRKMIFPRLFNDAIKLMDGHRAKGHMIVIVSGTTEHILKPFQKAFAPDRIVCTRLETNSDGICTGRVLGEICLGEEKRRAVEMSALQLDIDLGLSYAYSDHHSDIPFLKAVGNPVAVNPNEKLKKYAVNANWAIKYLS